MDACMLGLHHAQLHLANGTLPKLISSSKDRLTIALDSETKTNKTTLISLSLNLPLKPSSLENSQEPKILEQICPAECPIVLTGPKLKTTMPCASLAGLQ